MDADFTSDAVTRKLYSIDRYLCINVKDIDGMMDHASFTHLILLDVLRNYGATGSQMPCRALPYHAETRPDPGQEDEAR